MMWIGKICVGLGMLLGITACGCGDRALNRRLILDECWAAYSAGADKVPPIEIDTSQLPAEYIERAESKDGCGNPTTKVKVYNHSFKVVLVPTTQP